ncbi:MULTISPECIES: hypothetical protein [Bradyrhizobium]|jgi:hypothetical protein|uniref:hypothetical protein n=1 Tax=Bradyrhizobium TaxID=374 RepID=UPI000231C9B3|nr:hypothetical protein [Bradyrhizobium japonicum]AJA61969.1 hypothetical protein RN69_17695 [Bradyrhizobium japonicum]KMK00870.1 hypothetical protein CF64_01205 [Bradyrhizobium japonicum]MBR0759592.1 hypothetical protein [Bradyrhizobium japonicum]MCS3541663.1 hypothetical protein [Bradyrhizobium japonicum]MCS3991151.1 hypothetical protein [Bradyrhizobium japonicum]
MDMMSIVTLRPALAERRGGIRGKPVPAAQVPAGEGAMKLAPALAAIIHQSNPLDSAAQSYQGGAFVTLDFTPEVERPKAACSIGSTTT